MFNVASKLLGSTRNTLTTGHGCVKGDQGKLLKYLYEEYTGIISLYIINSGFIIEAKCVYGRV